MSLYLPPKICIKWKMIGEIKIVNRIPEGNAIFYHYFAIVKDPVDVIPLSISGKSMIGAWKRAFKYVGEIRNFSRYLLIVAGKNIIAWAIGNRIKISNKDYRSNRWHVGQSPHNNFSAFDLDGGIKVKMGVDTHQFTVPVFKQTDCTLSWPHTFSEATRHIGCGAEEKIILINTCPGFLIKDNIVLPKRR